jgi:sugar/nucleoside kinase (ribokinase family)
MTKSYQVVGIGNAIVDVIAQTDDSFLDHMGIEKGIMQLVERERAEILYGAMDGRRQVPGGSVANTLVGLGEMGLSTAFIGRVRDDALGRFYAEEMAADGTDFVIAPAPAAMPTSRSMIFVTPDGERSMNTFLGASVELGAADVDPAVAGRAAILFLEGYLFDRDSNKAAFQAAARACRDGGGRAGVSLSDPFCVDRHRADFRRLARELDYVIGNEREWQSLYQTQDLEEALAQAARDSHLVVCTRSGDEVVLIEGGERVRVPVERITPVDATGAGDQFAAGFLYGLSRGLDLETSGRMGCLAATEVITHYGARPQSDLRATFRQAGLP